MKKLILLVIIFGVMLSACGDPIIKATEIAKKACIAGKKSDVESMASFMSGAMFEQKQLMYLSNDPQLEKMLSTFNCEVKSTKKINNASFVISFKAHNKFEVKVVEGDLKVVSEQPF